LDINVSLESKTICLIAETFEAVVSFESYGTDATPIDVQYLIVDSSGKVVHSEAESLLVETNQIASKQFDGLTLDAGMYSLVVTTRYNGDVRDELVAQFTVQDCALIADTHSCWFLDWHFVFCWWVWVLLALLGLGARKFYILSLK